jgi:hypothetical protein
MNTTVRFSAEPMARKQVMVLAESILEEIVQKDYADRTEAPLVPLLLGDMDHVADYSGKNESIFITVWPLSFPTDHVVNIVVGEDSWSVDSELPKLSGDMLLLQVSVPVLLPVPVKKITVTVISRGHTISLSGYRADY